MRTMISRTISRIVWGLVIMSCIGYFALAFVEKPVARQVNAAVTESIQDQWDRFEGRK